jgi:putative DNA primase/helicase
VCVTDERIEANLYRDLRMTRPADVRDVRSALIAVDGVLIDEVELGGWIGDPGIGYPPLDMAACPNGLLDLRSRTLCPTTPRYFATTSLGVNYERAAPSPTRWLTFLRQLWPKDDQSIAALQEWFGYLLTPDTRQQKIMLLVGPKRSGKGTIMRVLKALLGEDSIAAPTLASLGTNFGLWPLIGKIAAIIGDARLGGRSDISQIVERLLSISGQDVLLSDN